MQSSGMRQLAIWIGLREWGAVPSLGAPQPRFVLASNAQFRWAELPANKTIDGTTGQTVTVVEVDANGRAVATGSGSVTAKAG